MLGEFLYGLTPRDEQTLFLEIRDYFIVMPWTLATFIAQGTFSPEPLVPKGKIGMVLAASCSINSASATSGVNATITVDDGTGQNSCLVAGNTSQWVTGNNIAHEIAMRPMENCLIRDNEIWRASFVNNTVKTVSDGEIIIRTRVLFIPRGNIGV